MMKKPFKDTKFGQFLKGAVNALPDLAGAALEIAANPASGVKLLVDVLKGKPDDPAAAAALAELEAEQLAFERELVEWERERAALAAQDLQGARDMQKAALAQDDLFSKRFAYYLASFVVVSATVFGALLFFVEVPSENRRMVEMFADVYLFGGAVTILQFFFGGAFQGWVSGVKDKFKEHV